MTHAQLQTAISASFRAFHAMKPSEQEAVLLALDFVRITVPRPVRDWKATMLADELIREDAKRRASK